LQTKNIQLHPASISSRNKEQANNCIINISIYLEESQNILYI